MLLNFLNFLLWSHVICWKNECCVDCQCRLVLVLRNYAWQNEEVKKRNCDVMLHWKMCEIWFGVLFDTGELRQKASRQFAVFHGVMLLQVGVTWPHLVDWQSNLDVGSIFGATVFNWKIKNWFFMFFQAKWFLGNVSVRVHGELAIPLFQLFSCEYSHFS